MRILSSLFSSSTFSFLLPYQNLNLIRLISTFTSYPSIEAVLLEVWNREMASGVPEASTSLTSPVNWCLFFGE
jgi:hypothetical protein